jgi:2-methylcitrate dehydratase PrpD
MEIVWRLLDHIVTATYQSLPAEALASSKRLMRDTLGAALAGSRATQAMPRSRRCPST